MADEEQVSRFREVQLCATVKYSDSDKISTNSLAGGERTTTGVRPEVHPRRTIFTQATTLRHLQAQACSRYLRNRRGKMMDSCP
jgi:hypothetical protein